MLRVNSLNFFLMSQFLFHKFIDYKQFLSNLF